MNMIVATVFLLIMNPMEFLRVHNQKENCHCDPSPLDLRGNLQCISLSVLEKTVSFFFPSIHHDRPPQPQCAPAPVEKLYRNCIKTIPVYNI